MVSIKSIRVERFKNIVDATLELSKLNVLVGANNSGKSSIIQALHFAIGLLQTINVAKRWPAGKSNSVTISIYPDQPLYSPSQDIYSLATGGKLKVQTSDAIKITLILDSGNQIKLLVRKGKNRNATVTVTGVKDAREISNIEHPFSIFSPGLAGVSRNEAHFSDGVLLRTIARGDSNLVLRNILYRLSKNNAINGKWDIFINNLHSMFPNIDLRVLFDTELDEYINAEMLVGGEWVPIELCGTGVLQATQILAYLNHFEPKLVVLDEPDSHLHPDNQRLLCSLLEDISENNNTQVILTTHSRHVIDALSGIASFKWLRSGTADDVEADDEIEVLVDLGALDLKERIKIPGLNCIVFTEDKKTKPLELLLESSGFVMDKIVVLPYYGVSNSASLKPLMRIIKSANKDAHVLIHRDRDFWPDDDIAAWESSIRKVGCIPFVTTGIDIEAYMINPKYLSEINDTLSEEKAIEIINAAFEQTKSDCIKKYVNGRIDCERKARRSGEVDAGLLAIEAINRIESNKMRYCQGKIVLSAIRQIFKKVYPDNYLLTNRKSRNLSISNLSEIAQQLNSKAKNEEAESNSNQSSSSLRKKGEKVRVRNRPDLFSVNLDDFINKYDHEKTSDVVCSALAYILIKDGIKSVAYKKLYSTLKSSLVFSEDKYTHNLSRLLPRLVKQGIFMKHNDGSYSLVAKERLRYDG